MHVVDETDRTHQSKSHDEPWISQAEESGVKPDAEKKNNTAAAQDDSFVRATQIRFVDDVEPVGHTKVSQF